MTTQLLFLSLAVLNCGVCSAQAVVSHRVRVQQLDNLSEFAAAYAISELVFVVRESKIFETGAKETSVENFISLKNAVKKGVPNEFTQKLIDDRMNGHHRTHFDKASAISNGDDGLYWKIKWYLFPSPGGFSGIPSEYHAVVRSDGTQVKPELYLCDDYDGNGPNDTIFSAIAFDDLLPIVTTKVDQKKLQHRAETKFRSSMTNFKVDPEYFRTLPPKRFVYPAHFASDDHDVEVWLVRFVHKNIKDAKNVKYLGSIAVWVTSDYVTSELTQGSWCAESNR